MKRILPLFVVVTCALQSFGVLAIQTKTVPNGIVKNPYLGVITAAGACAPYKWQVTSGSLPAGVILKASSDTKSITLSGAPTKAASYSFTISVTACGGAVVKTASKVVIQTSADHVVDLNWKASTSKNIAGYNIYRGPDGKSWKKVNVSLAASTNYNDLTVADRSTYYYAATAVDISGKESPKSNIAKAAIP
ncbi:MAG TPA: putative Ig domain-containing protein [Terriglobales bacterium]|nr:putative Ig domain-containing protein [Terriglobales bacterium]